MPALSQQLTDPIPHWQRTRLNAESVSFLAAVCRLEVDRMREREKTEKNSMGSMPVRLATVAKWLESKNLTETVGFSEIENVLAVHLAEQNIIVMDRNASLFDVEKAFSKPESSESSELDEMGLIRSMSILTVREMIGDHYIEIAALQLGEADRHATYRKYYKGILIKPCMENEWFFSGGFVRAEYEFKHLNQSIPRSSLTLHKLRLRDCFFEGLCECYAGIKGDKSPSLNEAILESAKHLGYPL